MSLQRCAVVAWTVAVQRCNNATTYDTGKLLESIRVPAAGMRFRTPAQLAAEQELSFDMRHVSRALEQLGGESVRQFAEEQYDRGWHRQRKQPRRVKLVSEVVRERIELVDVQETNGHAGNGRVEVDRGDGLVLPL